LLEALYILLLIIIKSADDLLNPNILNDTFEENSRKLILEVKVVKRNTMPTIDTTSLFR